MPLNEETGANNDVMEWKGKVIKTWGDYMNIVFAMKDKKEAMEFKDACIKKDGAKNTQSNIGYMIGYINDSKRRQELNELFEVEHPIFGKAIDVSPLHAFKAGLTLGKEMKKREEHRTTQ